MGFGKLYLLYPSSPGLGWIIHGFEEEEEEPADDVEEAEESGMEGRGACLDS